MPHAFTYNTMHLYCVLCISYSIPALLQGYSQHKLFLLCMYLIDLREAVFNSNQEIASVTHLNAIYDFKGWLAPYINTPHNHTTPHNFLFMCNDDGNAVMLYRNWSSDQWLPPPPQPAIQLLKVISPLNLPCSFKALLRMLRFICVEHAIWKTQKTEPKCGEDRH